jgi:3-carboxy-cis,cis-muconate cycloisomerase
MQRIIGGLQVNAERMRANLEVTRGQIYAESISTALAKSTGHAKAHTIVEHACHRALEEGRHLRDVVLADSEITAHVAAAELTALFEPQKHIRAAARLVDQALAKYARFHPHAPVEGAPCPSLK